jgi:hypothetical protein
MRLIITGKSRSGKSTALHRLIRSALQARWSHTLLADGKSVELLDYATATRHVYGDDEAEALAAALTATADRLTLRYQALRARKLLKAPAGDPRELIIIDEVQEFTRHPQHGKHVRAALTRIFEKSGALGDLVIVATQRATNAIPPAVRHNANAELRMLGVGFFQLVADGFPTRQGRVDPAAPLAGPDHLTPAALLAVLSAQAIARPPTQISRYEGAPGAGRTYALAHHPTPLGMRRITLDCRIHTHKSLLIDSLHQCGATAPTDATIADLADAAALALESAPSLLLLDNVTDAGGKLLGSLHRLLDAATEGAIALAPPTTEDHTRDPYASLRRRARLLTLQPLDPRAATELIQRIAPALDPASAQTIIQRSHGHPQTLAAYSERLATHGDDERHQLESYRAPARWLIVGVMLCLFIGIIYAERHLVENDIIGAVGTGIIAVTLWLLRPRFMKLTRPK